MNPLILGLLSPAVIGPIVTFLVSWIKRIPFIKNAEDKSTYTLIVRTVAVLLSLGGTIGAFMLTGISPDPAVIGDDLVVIVTTLIAFSTATGTHEVAKNK